MWRREENGWNAWKMKHDRKMRRVKVDSLNTWRKEGGRQLMERREWRKIGDKQGNSERINRKKWQLIGYIN